MMVAKYWPSRFNLQLLLTSMYIPVNVHAFCIRVCMYVEHVYACMFFTCVCRYVGLSARIVDVCVYFPWPVCAGCVYA